MKILLEARLESKSFQPLIGFLMFLFQKLWPKNNKLINYLQYFSDHEANLTLLCLVC